MEWAPFLPAGLSLCPPPSQAPPSPAHTSLTNGAVVAFPAGAALALAVLAVAVLRTVGIARALLTGGAHPAFFTLADSSGTNAVAAALQRAKF